MHKTSLLVALILGSAAASQAAITWSWNGAAPADPYKTSISNGMTAAVAQYNADLNMTYNVVVQYNSAVPTSQDDGFLGLIEFGTQFSQRCCQHEMSHHFGTGTYWNWQYCQANGQWTGTNAVALEKSFDGASAIEYCDSLHYWPYGLNYDTEWTATTGARQPLMMAAMRRDMGMSSGLKTSPIANGTYKIVNRYSGLALDVSGNITTNGATIDQWAYNGGNNQRWKLTQKSGNTYTIVGVQSSKALDNYNNAASGQDGARVDIWTANGGDNQSWWIQAGPSGGPWFKIINVHSGMALDIVNASSAAGAVVDQWSDLWGNGTQEWSFQTP